MKPVLTNIGEIDFDSLRIEDVHTIDGPARFTVTNWYRGDELVRVDEIANMLNTNVPDHVNTALGDTPLDQLTIRDIVVDEPSARILITEWMYGDEMVRRDAHVTLLVGLVVGASADIRTDVHDSIGVAAE